MVDAINQAQAQRAAAQDELNNRPAPATFTATDVKAMVDTLGDIGEALNRADPTILRSLSEALRLEAVYDADDRVVTGTIRPAHVASACVRGGT
jgi:hypothetical protein